jgi:hypothetical protein
MAKNYAILKFSEEDEKNPSAHLQGLEKTRKRAL